MQFPREDSSGHPLWGQLRGGGHGSWQSLRLPGQPLTSESSSRPGSPQVLVRGLQQPQTTAPSALPPVSWPYWEPAGCRACVGGRQRGTGRHRSCTHQGPQPLVSEALDPFPKWGRGSKIKKPPLFPFPPTPSPLHPPAFLGGETACIDLGPTQTAEETVPSDWGHPIPGTWPKLQDQASVQRSPGAEPALLQQVCLTLPAGMTTPPPPGLHTAAV